MWANHFHGLAGGKWTFQGPSGLLEERAGAEASSTQTYYAETEDGAAWGVRFWLWGAELAAQCCCLTALGTVRTPCSKDLLHGALQARSSRGEIGQL